MKIEQWKLADVKPYEHNPRINDQAVDAVLAPFVVVSRGVVRRGIRFT